MNLLHTSCTILRRRVKVIMLDYRKTFTIGTDKHHPGITVNLFKWKSLADQVEEARKLYASEVQVNYDYGSGSSYGPDDPKWTGRKDIPTKEAFLDEVHKPWSEGMNMVESLMEELNRKKIKNPITVRRVQKWDLVGDHYDLDRHRAGAEPWRTTHQTTRPGPRVINLLCNVGGNCNLTAKELAMTGVTATALCQRLELAGFSVRIVTYAYIHGLFTDAYQERTLQVWEVKPAGKPVAIYSIVNSVSPWYFRMIAWSSHYMLHGRTPTECHGQSRVIEEEAVGLVARTNKNEATYRLEEIRTIQKAHEELDRIIGSIHLLCS